MPAGCWGCFQGLEGFVPEAVAKLANQAQGKQSLPKIEWPVPEPKTFNGDNGRDYLRRFALECAGLEEFPVPEQISSVPLLATPDLRINSGRMLLIITNDASSKGAVSWGMNGDRNGELRRECSSSWVQRALHNGFSNVALLPGDPEVALRLWKSTLSCTPAHEIYVVAVGTGGEGVKNMLFSDPASTGPRVKAMALLSSTHEFSETEIAMLDTPMYVGLRQLYRERTVQITASVQPAGDLIRTFERRLQCCVASGVSGHPSDCADLVFKWMCRAVEDHENRNNARVDSMMSGDGRKKALPGFRGLDLGERVARLGRDRENDDIANILRK
jgi:hypothetical protein